MMTRSATHSPLELEEFGSSSSKGLVEIDAVFEVDSVSNSVSPMVEVDSVSHSVSPAEVEAAEAPSPSHVATSGFEPVDSRSRLTICRGACTPALRGALH